MEIRPGATGPLTAPSREAALPPELAALSSQLPPQVRQQLGALYQRAAAGDGSLSGILNPDTTAGAEALRAYFQDLAEQAPTKGLAELFEAASRAVATPGEERESDEMLPEFRKLLQRQALAAEALRETLHRIRQADIEAATDLLKRASRDQADRDESRLTAEALVAAGLVTAVALPVVSQSKLEGVTSTALARRQTRSDAGVDERLKRDALETARGADSHLRLEDFSGPGR